MGLVQFGGVNIAGFEFGCQTNGSCPLTAIYPPIKTYGGGNHPDGAGQMQHFFKDDNLNLFRLPVSWQYLVNDDLGGALNANNFGWYDQLVQSCLSTGAYCLVDVHNYARWSGSSKIIGQGGPTNAQFADLWKQIATKYASQPRIWFGTMNEPHDIPNITTWAATVQAAVTAIRGAGASSQYISLPGNHYMAAGSLVGDGSGAALAGVHNPNGTTAGLIFDVHKYLDAGSGGKDTQCATNGTTDLANLATWLRTNKRQALLSETGGGNTASCATYLCQEIAYLNQNADVYLGYVGWSAGSFSATYNLTLVPSFNATTGKWTDTSLVKACIARST